MPTANEPPQPTPPKTSRLLEVGVRAAVAAIIGALAAAGVIAPQVALCVASGIAASRTPVLTLPQPSDPEAAPPIPANALPAASAHRQ